MAKKFTNVGYFAKKKNDPNARQVVLTKSIKVELDERGHPKPVYIQMYDIRKSDKMSDEKFEELKSWKLKDLVIVSEE